MVTARYDGHADWYDETFRNLGDSNGSGGLLCRLLGPPDPSDPVCLDVACGTGLHFDALRSAGYRVVGTDLSGDQLRVAATRNSRLAQADAARLPFRDGCFAAVTMTFIHSDVDDFAGVIAQAARVLKPGGRLVYLGFHPSFVGTFVWRGDEVAAGELRFAPGYGDERYGIDPTGKSRVRSRVGARCLTLATFLGAFLAVPTLRLASFAEFDTSMQPWRPDPGDGRVLPWNIALTATRL